MSLTKQERALLRAFRAANIAPTANVTFQVAASAASAPPERTYATKKDREAGKGFQCPKCDRNDLRVAPHAAKGDTPASTHEKDVKTDARTKVYCTPFAI